MNKLKQLIQWCKTNDKRAHFYVAFILAQITLLLLPFFTLELAFGISTLISYSAFVGKELYDKWFGTGFDLTDIYADFIGWIGGSISSSLIIMAIAAIKQYIK